MKALLESSSPNRLCAGTPIKAQFRVIIAVPILTSYHPPLRSPSITHGVTLDKYRQYTDHMAMGIFRPLPFPLIASTGPAF